jgi:putative heme-binding domain-containing protein
MLNTLLDNWAGLPQEMRAELWTAALERKECGEHFQKLRERLNGNGDSLAEFRAALAGGDPVRGRKLFYESPLAMCATCHAAEPGVPGGTAGPSLEKVATHGAEYLLRSLVEPSAEFAPGYAAIAVTLKAGEPLAGVLWKRDANEIEIKLSDGKIRKVSTSEIEKMDTPVSPMPPMGQILNLGQIRDLVAFLKTLTPGNRDLLASRKLKPQELAQRESAALDANRETGARP